MPESSQKADLDIKKIEAQIQGLRDEVRDMMETIGKLSLEFSKVLLIFSHENSGTNEPFEETKWGKHSFS